MSIAPLCTGTEMTVMAEDKAAGNERRAPCPFCWREIGVTSKGRLIRHSAITSEMIDRRARQKVSDPTTMGPKWPHDLRSVPTGLNPYPRARCPECQAIVATTRDGLRTQVHQCIAHEYGDEPAEWPLQAGAAKPAEFWRLKNDD